MTTTTRTTELEAVNTILSTIGEAPLNSLSGSLPVDGTVAKNVLSEVSREVQSAGWHFNTHYKATLTRDTNNKIPVGTNVVRVELDPNLVPKADYDLVHLLLPFNEIPEQAKRYITIRSARVFHDRTLGANTLHKFSQEDEKQALSILRNAEARTGDFTIFDTPEQIYTIARNNRGY